MNDQNSDRGSWHNLLYTDGVRISFIGVCTILALFLAAETMSVAGNLGRPAAPATDTITVQGDGRATMPPDVSHVSFTIENSAKTVSDAQGATTNQANDAIAYVKGQGVAEKDIKTLSYAISPEYSYQTCLVETLCPGSPKITGYRVSETVQVTMRDLSAVGTLLEGLGSRQVQNVSGPDFALDDPTAGYDAARADAIAKAKVQAVLLAKQLGVRLGKIVNFSESSGNYTQPAYGLSTVAMDKAAATSPTISTGENTYNASVSVTYEIR
jgi:hypothetical protein